LANWFIAFPFGAALELPPAPERVRVFTPSDRHLTVAFLGPVGEPAARAAWERTEAILKTNPIPTFEVALGEVTLLGGRRPTAISALLSAGREPVAGAMAAIRSELVRSGCLRADPRPPLPHVTLGRVHRRADAGQRRRAERWARGLRLDARASLRELALYTWAADRNERLFAVAGRLPLPHSTPPA
jgi:2'-5' RNA ligase